MAFTKMGRSAQVLPCYAVIHSNGDNFLLGYKNVISSSRQVDGHVVCLIDKTILVDFGLTNVRLYGRGLEGFPLAVATNVKHTNIFPTEMAIDTSLKITWYDDYIYPGTNRVMAVHKPIIKKLYKQYKVASQLQK